MRYDGASVICGWVNGLQAKIKAKAPQAAYIHCYARLSLVVVDSLKSIPELVDLFNVILTLYTFISNSNTRHELFVQAQKELERSVKTRWFYWFQSIQK